MPKTKNKKITLDTLAGMMKRGFDSMERKFDKQFAENKKEHKQILQKLTSLERKKAPKAICPGHVALASHNPPSSLLRSIKHPLPKSTV